MANASKTTNNINESIHLVDKENKNVFYTDSAYDLKNYIVNNVSKDVIKICDYVSQGLYVFCNAYNGIHEMLEEMAQEQGLVDSSNDVRYVAYTGTTEDDDYETIDYSDGIVYDYVDFKIFEVTQALGKIKFIGSRLQRALGQFKSKYRLVNGLFRRNESLNEDATSYYRFSCKDSSGNNVGGLFRAGLQDKLGGPLSDNKIIKLINKLSDDHVKVRERKVYKWGDYVKFAFTQSFVSRHQDDFNELTKELKQQLDYILVKDTISRDDIKILYRDANQIAYVLKSDYNKVKGISESLLLEKTRQELINKSRDSDNYTSKDRQGENRYTRRLRSQIANSVRDYNRIDMDAFWKGDILDFDVRVHGETNDYVVSLDFSNILRRLQQEVKSNKDRLEFKCVLRALVGAFNSDSDLLVSCTCPDWKYRQAYWATKGRYNSGEPQPSNGMAIANPNDTKGGGCKHVNLVLSNLDWMMKIASVINNYIKWTRDNMGRNYADYIFPKVYGMDYKKAVQLSLLDKEDKFGDAILPSDVETINQAINRGMIGKDDKGRFTRGNEYRFQKKYDEPEENPDQMKLPLDDEENEEENRSIHNDEKEQNVRFEKEHEETPEDEEENIRFEK